MQYDPETVRPHLTPDQYALYRLIWNRFVASQMTPAIFDETTVDVDARPSYLFRVKGSVPKFAGLDGGRTGRSRATRQATRPTRADEEDGRPGCCRRSPKATGCELQALRPEQKFTQPPPRFTEATLVKELEENGIGRPSTYASILGVLQDRDYVEQDRGARSSRRRSAASSPTCSSRASTTSSTSSTPRNLEEELDEIEEGKTDYDKHARRASTRSSRRTSTRAVKEMTTSRRGQADRRGVRQVRHADGDQGRASSAPSSPAARYPECTNTRELETHRAGEPTRRPRIERGVRELRQADGRQARPLRPVPRLHRLPRVQDDPKLIATKQGGLKAASRTRCSTRSARSAGRTSSLKQGRFGEFTACSNYPALQVRQAEDDRREVPEGRRATIVERKSRRGKVFFGCANYPDCDFVLWNRPVAEPCPECGAPFLVEKITKRHGRQLVCNNGRRLRGGRAGAGLALVTR